jgi:hypothetical protein
MAAPSCIALGGMRVDRMVAQEVLDRLQPLGVEAAVAAAETREKVRSEMVHQLDLALQLARYEAIRAQREYDATDPDNRLVASELERRWNERLAAIETLEAQMEVLSAQQDNPLTANDRERLMALGNDLPRALDSLVDKITHLSPV